MYRQSGGYLYRARQARKKSGTHMTAMIEYFSEPNSGLKVGMTVFRDSEAGRFKILILPKGESLWFSIGIRVKNNKLDLECLNYTFHFAHDEKGEYHYRNGQGPVSIGKDASKHMQKLVENLREAEKAYKESASRKNMQAKK